MVNSFYLSAAHKSSGKTIISLGLCAALNNKNLKVQPFKKGPDYIDPIWLSQASNNHCYNLDFYNMTNQEIIDLYEKYSEISNVSIIEGNKGLFDGMSVAGGDANADMAKLLNTPVVLIIDASGITRGVAPLVNGYKDFDKNINIQGVILNKVASTRHESKLIQALEHYSDVDIIGSVRRSSELIIDERHLGLIPANERAESQKFINTAANIIKDQVDLSIFTSNKNTIKIPVDKLTAPSVDITIAVAKDKVFGFYYQDDLDKFQSLGVKVKYFNTLEDSHIPMCDGLFIGGGFPETHLDKLSENKSLLNDIKQKIKNGLPTYAECGGLMYLSKSIEDYKMVSVIDAKTKMHKTPIGRGYVELEPTNNHPWSGVAKKIYAHEFHYSFFEKINNDTCYAYNVKRGVGINNIQDGIVQDNLLASYSHLRNILGNEWVEQFVNFIKSKKI